LINDYRLLLLGRVLRAFGFGSSDLALFAGFRRRPAEHER
jgi:hypothetical protein